MTDLPEITAADAGVWLDGAQGWHNTYRVIERAETYGFEVSEEERAVIERYKTGDSPEPDDSEIVSDLAADATDYLRERAPEGYTFEWDAGELALVEVEGDEADE